jgi:hypothetical protein
MSSATKAFKERALVTLENLSPDNALAPRCFFPGRFASPSLPNENYATAYFPVRRHTPMWVASRSPEGVVGDPELKYCMRGTISL